MGNQEKLNPESNELYNQEDENQQHLVLHNDDHNTFEYVIETLMEVCQHDSHQAEQCAFITHYKGKCDVKKGDFEELSFMKGKLTSKGLSSTIE